jgi:molybdopterin synthase catalytic subunit
MGGSITSALPESEATPSIEPPEHGDWIDVTSGVLPVELAWSWARRPECGGVVTFCGTVRDHSEGHPGVTQLEYEAYAEQVNPRLSAVAQAARERWPEIGRLALLHRVGLLVVGEVSVVVVASTPHRSEAFAAAQFCIDTLKATVPIWKLETWSGGTDWTTCALMDENGSPAPARPHDRVAHVVKP